MLEEKNDLIIDDTSIFRELLNNCHCILYLCDNSGEIVLNCPLIEQLKERCEVVASVKSGSIVNADVTIFLRNSARQN